MNKFLLLAFLAAAGFVTFVAVTEKSAPTAAAARGASDEPASPLASNYIAATHEPTANERGEVAPFVVRDTSNDSPGTNYVTRVVTFGAEISGTEPIVLQWKVDKGAGFTEIPDATNTTYRIGNAQVEHTGLYALFATNAVGSTNTTPQPLIVIEGED